MAPTRQHARRTITQAPKKPDYRDPESNASITESHNFSDRTIDLKGPAVFAVLMSNITDPCVLWQLVRSSSSAKRAFEHRPKSYLRTSMAGMPKDLHRLASVYIDVAIIELITMRSSSEAEISDLARLSYVKEIVYQLFDKSYESFQVTPPYPLTALHALAEAYEAIEILLGSGIWRAMETTAGTDNSSTISHRTRKALWYYEIFCAVFCSDRLVVSRPFSKGAGFIKDFELYHKMQEYFLGELNQEEINDVSRIWDDLSAMLESAYKSRLAQLFEDEYISAIKPDGAATEVEKIPDTPLTGEWPNYNITTKNTIVERAVTKFDNMINYRMSLGVVYLSLIHKANCPQIMSVDYGIDCDIFFKKVVRHLINQERMSNEYKYQLHAVNAGSKNIASGGFDGTTKTSDNGGYPPGWKLEIFYGPSFTLGTLRHMVIDGPVLVGFQSPEI